MTELRGALLLDGRLDGVDVSQVQDAIDYRAVARAGFRFAIVKSSEGVSYTDPRALRHIDGFRNAGMYALPYAFLRPSMGNARGQVDRLWASFGDTYPGRIALDIETRNAATPNAVLHAFLLDCLAVCLEYGAAPPILYSYPDYLKQLAPIPAELGACPLWLASFPFEPWAPPAGHVPSTPAPWHAPTFHQYSGNGGFLTPGFQSVVDRDLFLGDERAFRDLLGFVHDTDPAPPEMA